jgi:NitT/TauT family transport system permease protein
MSREPTVNAGRDRQRAARAARLTARYVIYIAVALAIWQVVYVLWSPPAYLLASVPQVFDFYKDFHALVLSSAGVTAYEIILGFALAMVSGVILAILFDSITVVRRALWPVIVFSQIVPKIALAPWLLLIFGFGNISKVFLAWIVAFFPVLIDTLAGLESLPESAQEMAATMRMSRIQFYRHVKLPLALPQIFAGAKVAMTLAVVGAVVGEFIASDTGLGHLIVIGQGDLSAAEIIVGILTLTVIGTIFYGVIEITERIAIPWHVSHRRQAARRAIPVEQIPGPPLDTAAAIPPDRTGAGRKQ